MKFLIDVNASGTATLLLIERGHDAVQVNEKDPRMSDSDVLAWAVREHRIVVTTDKDFEEMIWRQGMPHCGILRLENLPRTQRRALLLDAIDHYGQDLESGAIVIASRTKFRVRKPA